MQEEQLKLVVVDDAQENLRLLDAILGDDFELHLFTSALDCLDHLTELKPDLVLLDVIMPGMDGYELCRRLKSDPATDDIPVIFISAGTTPEERLAGYEAGGDEYVVKPFDVEELLNKIERSLDARREEIKLRVAAEEATRVAKAALIGSNELATLNRYVRNSAHATSYDDLAEHLLEAIRGFGLSCGLVLHTDSGSSFFGCTADSIEGTLLEKFNGSPERIMDYQARTIVNASRCTILVKNMPVNDEPRYVRLKEHLAAAVDATESRMESLEMILNASERRFETIRQVMNKNDQQLTEIQSRIANSEAERRAIMTQLLTEVEARLFGMGLEDDQEVKLVKMLDEGVQKVYALPSIGEEIEASFKAANKSLSRLLSEQPAPGK
tara:strand:+ start:7467 stop:8615 length:1149 start_codon:yes stop_codon:yes gene_type:complete